MATVLLLTDDPRDRARLHAALSTAHRVVDLENWAQIPALLRRRPAHLVVFTPSCCTDDAQARLQWMVRHHPSVALLLYTGLVGGGREAWRFGRFGADDLVVEGMDDSRTEVQRAARRALARALGRQVGRSVHGRVPPLLERCVVRAIYGATLPMTPEDLAEPEGIDVGSLRRRLRSAGLPPTGRILRWGQLFRAAAALDRDEMSVEAIALGLGYSTGTALSRALRRDVGHPPSTLRERGGLRCAIQAFLNREGTTGPGPELVRH